MRVNRQFLNLRNKIKYKKKVGYLFLQFSLKVGPDLTNTKKHTIEQEFVRCEQRIEHERKRIQNTMWII